MKVLVVYATRHGATAGIAERIADVLTRRGLDVTLAPAGAAIEPALYGAYVVGGAAYMTHWLGDVSSFARHNRRYLASRPVWLYSSGPIGMELTDSEGRDIRIASEPREWSELRESLHPRGTRVFFGAYDPSAEPVGLAERLARHLPDAARSQIPAGDFRDWPDIEAWANDIADALMPEPMVAAV
jgi:menaquinone-dependent protoporphyrinogen oxidase